MTKFIVHCLSFIVKKKIILLLLISLLLPIYDLRYTIHEVYAADSSPSADIKAKLKLLQDEIASKAAQLKKDVSQKLQNKAYVGFIKSKSDTSLTIATTKGIKMVNINQFTVLSSKGKVITLKNLGTDDYIAALGDVDDNDVLTARKVVKISAVPDEKQIILGQVTSVDTKTFSIQKRDNQKINFSTDKDTTFTLGKEDGDLSDIKSDKQVIVVGIKSKDNLYARFVYMLPLNATSPTPQPATSSAESTSSATPTPHPSKTTKS